MNKSKAFPSLTYSALTSFSSISALTGQKTLDFLETFKNPTYYEIILITPGIIKNVKLKPKRAEELTLWNC